jgi:predicted transcriptional regulator
MRGAILFVSEIYIRLQEGERAMKVNLKTKFIRKKLIRKNLSQNWLASRAGITSGYMSQLMDGSRYPSPKLRQRLMDVFPECEFDELFLIRENA